MSETMLRAICLTVLTSASRLCRCLNFDRTGGALNRKSPKASKKRQSEGKMKREDATMGRKKGAALAQAILQNCERDYTTLQQVFGGLTPQRMPFVVQVNSGATGASHSSCIGTDIAIGGNSGKDVDFVRSLLVAEADEVFMANLGHGWLCAPSPAEA